MRRLVGFWGAGLASWGMGRPCAALGLALALFVGAAPEKAAAQKPAQILAERFDSRRVNPQEVTLIQIALVEAGLYRGWIDGKWGRISQRALRDYARKNLDFNWTPNIVAALAAQIGRSFLQTYAFEYRFLSPYSAAVLVPTKVVSRQRAESFLALWSNTSGTLRFGVLSRDANGVHQVIEERMSRTIRRVRGGDRWVTIGQSGGKGLLFARSDRVDGRWITLIVWATDDRMTPLAWTVALGYAVTSRAPKLNGPTPYLDRLWRETDAFFAAEGRKRASDVIGKKEQPERRQPGGAGTGFFINSTEVVTNQHVIDGCRRVETADGRRFRVLRTDREADLALLRAPMKAPNWLKLGDAGLRLGQELYAAGYPYFELYTKDVTVTRGVASAKSGLLGDRRNFTMTAPIQPGNSGGPVLDRRGAVIGVVVAQISEQEVAKATGTRPQNINYAVTLRELRRFLTQTGARYELAKSPTEPVRDGVSDEVLSAILPILCRS